MPTTLKINNLRIDGGTQPRAQLDGVTVSEYADAMERGVEFPPVKVMHDGDNYWLYDGFHRLKAAQNIGRTEIDAEVEQGTKEDAQWASLAANKDHGLRRSKSDVRRAVKRAIDMKGEQCSTYEIAKHVGASQSTVWRRKKELEEDPTNSVNQSEKTTGRDGRTIDTSNIGSSQTGDTQKSTGDGSPKPPTSTPSPPSSSGGDTETKPMKTGAPGRRRRRDRRTRESEIEPMKSSEGDEDTVREAEDVTAEVLKAITKIRESEGVQALRDFADEQHHFSSKDRQRVKNAAESLTRDLTTIIDNIKS